jgi:hypothetical protein
MIVTSASKTPNLTHKPLMPGMVWSEISDFDIAIVIILIIVKCILILCILFGNVLVVAAFCRYPKLRKTMTNYFLVSLAVSDILYGLF